MGVPSATDRAGIRNVGCFPGVAHVEPLPATTRAGQRIGKSGQNGSRLALALAWEDEVTHDPLCCIVNTCINLGLW